MVPSFGLFSFSQFPFVFLFLILLPYSWATFLNLLAPLMQGALKHSFEAVCLMVFYACSVKTSLLQVSLFIFATVG